MDVKLVNIFVNVTDQNGAIVGGLTRDDFAVFEDGRPQEIAVFERQSELPLNLTLAIDTSGSVHKDMSEEASAARRFAHAILRPQDQMSVLQFATERARADAVHQQAGARSIAAWASCTAIGRRRSTTRSAWARKGWARKQGRKVLVVVSDGDDTAKKLHLRRRLWKRRCAMR